MSDRMIRHGGLFRCCLATAAEYEGPEIPGETVIECKYEGKLDPDPDDPPGRIRLAEDGVWEWDRP